MTDYSFSYKSSLEKLEQRNYGDPSQAPTSLVRRCIELTKVPLADFSTSDLRLMIGQQFGLTFLIPIALEKLKDDIFIEADYYEGDLLSNMLNIEAEFWKKNRNYWTQLNQLLNDRRQELAEKKITTTKFDGAIL
jgi:hypothetical protein